MELFQCGTHIRLLLPYMPIHTLPVKCGIYLTARTHVCLDQPHLMCFAATPGSRLQNWTAQTARLQQASPGGTQWQSKRVTLGNNTFSGCWYQRDQMHINGSQAWCPSPFLPPRAHVYLRTWLACTILADPCGWWATQRGKYQMCNRQETARGFLSSSPTPWSPAIW